VTTRVHNTVTVDDRGQMTHAGRFMVLDWFNAYSKSVIDADENILGSMQAYHKGYRGVQHERTVTVFTDERWLVQDKLTSRRSHTYRLHWLLPDWEFEIRESEFNLRLRSPYGWVRLCVLLDARISDIEYRISIIRAGKLIHGEGNALPFEGWFSPTYGTKLPALSFAVEVTSLQNVTFTSEFIFPR
jgi:hypothetical protein